MQSSRPPIVLGMLAALLVGLISWQGRAEDLSGYRSTVVGYCKIVYRDENKNIVPMIQTVCSESVSRIYWQLGITDITSVQPLFELRVAPDTTEMKKIAPRSYPTWARAVTFSDDAVIVFPLAGPHAQGQNDWRMVLEHEISHMAFHVASGNARVPRWFSEGVAILQSETYSLSRISNIWWASMINDIDTLRQISEYPVDRTNVERAYAQAADFVSFLVQRVEWEGIARMLSLMRNGDSFEQSFRKITGAPVAAMELKWRRKLFRSTAWLRHVTGSGLWLGLASLLAIFGFFVVRKRKKRRLREMAAEEAIVEAIIEDFDRRPN